MKAVFVGFLLGIAAITARCSIGLLAELLEFVEDRALVLGIARAPRCKLLDELAGFFQRSNPVA
jgi:hypothetical protein